MENIIVEINYRINRMSPSRGVNWRLRLRKSSRKEKERPKKLKIEEKN